MSGLTSFSYDQQRTVVFAFFCQHFDKLKDLFYLLFGSLIEHYPNIANRISQNIQMALNTRRSRLSMYDQSFVSSRSSRDSRGRSSRDSRGRGSRGSSGGSRGQGSSLGRQTREGRGSGSETLIPVLGSPPQFLRGIGLHAVPLRQQSSASSRQRSGLFEPLPRLPRLPPVRQTQQTQQIVARGGAIPAMSSESRGSRSSSSRRVPPPISTQEDTLSLPSSVDQLLALLPPHPPPIRRYSHNSQPPPLIFHQPPPPPRPRTDQGHLLRHIPLDEFFEIVFQILSGRLFDFIDDNCQQVLESIIRRLGQRFDYLGLGEPPQQPMHGRHIFLQRQFFTTTLPNSSTPVIQFIQQHSHRQRRSSQQQQQQQQQTKS